MNWMQPEQVYGVLCCIGFSLFIVLSAWRESKRREAKIKAQKLADAGHRWNHNVE